MCVGGGGQEAVRGYGEVWFVEIELGRFSPDGGTPSPPKEKTLGARSREWVWRGVVCRN